MAECDQLSKPRAWVRDTPARRAVLEALAVLHAHPSSGEILEAARRINPRVGRATLFRALQDLVVEGYLRPLVLPKRRTAYVRTGGGHHHFVCLQCAAVEELTQCPGCSVGAGNVDVRGHVLELFGLCARCLGQRVELPQQRYFQEDKR